jgi:hypothetical protein
MTTSPRRRTLAVIAALSLTALLGACASPAPGAGGSPSGSDGPTAAGEVAAAWLDEGRAVGVVTWGSSGCVPVAGEPMLKDGVLTVELSDVEGRACTMDYAPRGTLVTLPSGVDASHDLDIVITGTYASQTRLAGDAAFAGSPTDATEYLPSAGWFDGEGFLVLTWGSSTCVPRLEGAEVTGAAEVTATFATPPADQVCTADMGPRVTVGSIAGVEATSGVQLVLAGDGFDGQRVPLAGTR